VGMDVSRPLGEVEDDVVPQKYDVVERKSDVDPPKDDVACPVSRVWAVGLKVSLI